MPEYHLGIYMGHDTGVAIVDDKLNILWVFEEERFNGEKMTYFNPYFSLKEMIKLDFNRFRTITFGFNPDEAQVDFLKKFVRFQKVRSNEVLSYLSRKVTWDEVRFVGHHDCHAAGAFFPSGYDHSAILVADGTGESESTSFYMGEGNSISLISSELTNEFSLGFLYQYFTEWLGYRSDNTSQHCGKIMGLASYGAPVYKERIRSLLERDGDGYRWPGGSLMGMRGEMAKALGPPQPRPVNEFNRLQADVAASIQALLEKIIIEKLRMVKEIRPFENLCFSGGVAMNSQLNYHILKSGICRNLFVQPLASDRGIALGAALASAAKISGSRPAVLRRPAQNIYLGYRESSPRKELDRLINEYDLPIHVENENISPEEIARLLHENQIIALFQGRQEIGPRALGNRSILAAPTIYARDQTNRLIKYREPWRPFAPTVLEEEVGNFFDINRPEPFMTVIYGVLPGMTTGIEGITHVDRTARLQTISHEQNLLFHSIIKEYHKISGIPIVLNTSFNINGQPIVRSMYDAILTFLCSGIDGLLIGNTLARKTKDLPKDHINRLDRILSEATRDVKSIVIKVLDYSKETEDLLLKFLDCACIKFRKIYGSRPVSRCYINGHTKMSWNIISKMESSVKEFVYGDQERPRMEEGEICVIVTGDRLIEASSRPTRTYVKFDRNIFRELIEDYFQKPDCHRYFLLDREFHLFDIDYLHSRFESHKLNDAVAVQFRNQGTKAAAGKKTDRIASPDSRDEAPTTNAEREDMYEALADA
jgi:carbamoyltransferase